MGAAASPAAQPRRGDRPPPIGEIERLGNVFTALEKSITGMAAFVEFATNAAASGRRLDQMGAGRSRLAAWLCTFAGAK
jgi:hypothetical protein